MDNGLLTWVIDHFWLPMSVAVAHLYQQHYSLKSSVSKAIGIMETQIITAQDQRREDEKRNDDAHQQIIAKIDRHHDRVMARMTEVHDLLVEHVSNR